MDKSYSQSSKELRFVTSAEQMIPFLDRIRESKRFTDDSDDLNACEINEIEPTDEVSNINNDEISEMNNDFATDIVHPPVLPTDATSASVALPNIYEEYVNFIDLSVLNPIIDATNCQRDSLIESEIREL